MSWLSNLFAGGASNVIEAIGEAGDKIFTSDDERNQFQLELTKVKQNPMLMQAMINVNQAQHRSVFVAGARPFLLWVCGLGFLFAFVINPILQWLMPEIGAPVLPLEAMDKLTFGLLGLAGLRTIEKIKGVSK